jgi:hypothetical protein
MAVAGFPMKTQNGFAVTESRRRGVHEEVAPGKETSRYG